MRLIARGVVHGRNPPDGVPHEPERVQGGNALGVQLAPFISHPLVTAPGTEPVPVDYVFLRDPAVALALTERLQSR